MTSDSFFDDIAAGKYIPADLFSDNSGSDEGGSTFTGENDETSTDVESPENDSSHKRKRDDDSDSDSDDNEEYDGNKDESGQEGHSSRRRLNDDDDEDHDNEPESDFEAYDQDPDEEIEGYDDEPHPDAEENEDRLEALLDEHKDDIVEACNGTGWGAIIGLPEQLTDMINTALDDIPKRLYDDRQAKYEEDFATILEEFKEKVKKLDDRLRLGVMWYMQGSW